MSDFGLTESVWFTGDRDDIPELLRTMDIFVLPSLGEGISNTILEAMATGLPVVATQVGGNPELVENGVNGMLVPSSEPESLAAAVGWLVEHKQQADEMGQRGLSKVRQRFGWDRTVSDYLSVYDELLDSVRN